LQEVGLLVQQQAVLLVALPLRSTERERLAPVGNRPGAAGCKAFARSFIDDLLVAGGETAEEHIELVQRVFDRLREVGLKCHPTKY
jgi:hypothetical protein